MRNEAHLALDVCGPDSPGPLPVLYAAMHNTTKGFDLEIEPPDLVFKDR